MKLSKLSKTLFLLNVTGGFMIVGLWHAGSTLTAEYIRPGLADVNIAANDPDTKQPGKDPSESEEEIFKEENIVTPSEKVKDDAISTMTEKKSLTFTGFLNSRTSVNYKRSSILRDIELIDTNNFLSYFQSDFVLDARLMKAIRGYVNFSADYYPAGLLQTNTLQSALLYPGIFPFMGGTYSVPVSYLGIPAYFAKSDSFIVEKINAAFSINELFVDVNIGKAVYFRAGKQVLQWGVGYLWSPTDLVNIEKKNIFDWSQVRKGTYGLKMHIPFGTTANIYSFVNMNKARNLSDMSLANRLEFLIINTEVGFSALLKKKNVPVYGFDFTSRLLGFDIHGEAGVSFGDNNRRLSVFPWYLTSGASGLPVDLLYRFPDKTSILDYKVHGKWIPQASFGFGRGFEVKDIKDRLRLDFEVFYNHAGYGRNVFEKDPYTVAYFLSRNLYVPNYYGKYYAGAFVTIRQMFVEELSAAVNCIVNIKDQTSVVSGMLTYSPFYDFYLNLTVTGFIGKQNREYTVSGNYGTAELSVKIVF